MLESSVMLGWLACCWGGGGLGCGDVGWGNAFFKVFLKRREKKIISITKCKQMEKYKLRASIFMTLRDSNGVLKRWQGLCCSLYNGLFPCFVLLVVFRIFSFFSPWHMTTIQRGLVIQRLGEKKISRMKLAKSNPNYVYLQSNKTAPAQFGSFSFFFNLENDYCARS